MGVIRQFLRDYGFVHKSEIKRSAFRGYAAAQMGRLVSDWVTTSTSIDQDIRAGIGPVRARARDLSQNNEFARAYLRTVRKNVVGASGFVLQVRSRFFPGKNGKPELDRVANDIIEQSFAEWGKPENATVTGMTSFRKVQELVIEGVARDGEAFVRMVRSPNINRFSFTLQLVEPEAVDHTYSTELKGGNVIRMGIEVNPWRRPIAYHVMRSANPLDLYGVPPSGQDMIRISASDMIHVFDPERAMQTRGISWMAPVMLAMHNLKGYSDAAIINARIGASKMGFFRDPTGTEEPYMGDGEDEETGELISEVAPGQLEDIGQKEFTAFDPKYPDQQYDPFVKSLLRGMSAGLGMAYSSLSNDQREATWSSLRTELAEERENWKMIQSWFIESFLNRIYSEWLSMALISEAIPGLTYDRYRKFNVPEWVGRRWYWVDPLKEVQANKEALAAGLKSKTRIVAEEGGDLEELYQEIQHEQEMEAEYGLTFDLGGKENADQGDSGSTEEGSSEEGDLSGQGGNVPRRGNGSDRVLVRGALRKVLGHRDSRPLQKVDAFRKDER